MKKFNTLVALGKAKRAILKKAVSYGFLSMVIFASALGMVATSVSPTHVYADSSNPLNSIGITQQGAGSTSTGLTGGLISIINFALNFLYIGICAWILIHNIIDIAKKRDGGFWSNIKDILVGLAVTTAIVKEAFPLATGLGTTITSDVVGAFNKGANTTISTTGQ